MKIGKPEAGDDVVEQDGVYIYVDAESRQFLKDCEVDYVETLADQGFKIHNPHAVRSCGCGSSFEPPPPEAVSNIPPEPPESRSAAA
jgi:iron-sulfur cluster assembly protein